MKEPCKSPKESLLWQTLHFHYLLPFAAASKMLAIWVLTLFVAVQVIAQSADLQGSVGPLTSVADKKAVKTCGRQNQPWKASRSCLECLLWFLPMPEIFAYLYNSLSDITDYGATADGETDISTALLDAYNDCIAGGVVVIPDGDYALVSNTLRCVQSIDLRSSIAPGHLGNIDWRKRVGLAIGRYHNPYWH